jgi:hypothetical protein
LLAAAEVGRDGARCAPCTEVNVGASHPIAHGSNDCREEVVPGMRRLLMKDFGSAFATNPYVGESPNRSSRGLFAT